MKQLDLSKIEKQEINDSTHIKELQNLLEKTERLRLSTQLGVQKIKQ